MEISQNFVAFSEYMNFTCKGEEAINCLSRSPDLPLGVEVANLPSMDPVTDPGLLGGVAKLGLLG